MAKKIVIASGKGGVGKTSVTICLGKALADEGKKVLLIDCDTLRSIDILLGADENIVYNWGDVIRGRCNMEDAIYNAGEVDLMTCPRDYMGVNIKSMRDFMTKLDPLYDYILLDSPAGLEMGFIAASYVSDKGLVVSTPDPVCVRSACQAAEEMKKYGVKNIRLVINSAIRSEIKKNRMLNIDKVIDLTEIQLIGVVPEDECIRHASMGKPIFSKDNISYKAFTNIAKRIDGHYVPLHI